LLEEFKDQGIALHMIDLGGDVTGNHRMASAGAAGLTARIANCKKLAPSGADGEE
jgi:hypothetical protein